MKINYFILEVKNVLGNFMGLFFGFVFPLIVGNIVIFSKKEDVPVQYLADFKITVFVTMITIIPLSLALVSFPALFAQETEKGITKRMVLFGYNSNKQLINKMLANLLVIILGTIIYFFGVGWVNDIKMPSNYSALILISGLFIFAIDLYLISFAITWWLKKFNIVYGITMIMYFTIMILTGIFGVTPDKFGDIIETIANGIPTTLLIDYCSKNWLEDSYDLGNYPWVLLGFTIFSVLCFVVSKYRTKLN